MTVTGIKHGRKAYVHHGCRCTRCRDDNSAYMRDWRQARATGERRRRWWAEPDTTSPVRWIPPGAWVDDAACRVRNVHEVPHSYYGKWARWGGLEAAVATCSACPVLEQCRRWVLLHRVDPCPVHIVAGMTPTERNSERRRLGISVPGSPGKGDTAA